MHEWLKGDLNAWVENANAQLHWISHGPVQSGPGPIWVPMTIHSKDHNTSPYSTYITSLRCGWFDYLAQEMEERPLLAWLIRRLGSFAQVLGLDELILMGNLPVSTNLFSSEHLYALPHLVQELRAQHPKHYLAVRNLIPSQHGKIIKDLTESGFFALPQRVVYHFDLRIAKTGKKPSHLQRDISLLKNSGLKSFVHQSITREESQWIAHLYRLIYIDKHSAFNALYTADFFYDMIQSGAMQCMKLCDTQGELLAFALLYSRDSTLSVPALGYDTLSAHSGLYRMLFASLWLYTQEQGLNLNYSSGAGDFKRKRGANPELEYTLIAPPRSTWNVKHNILKYLQNLSAKTTAQDLIKHGA